MNQILLVLIMLLAACGQDQVSNLDEAWNQKNDPKLMGFDEFSNTYKYTTTFSKLPLEASLSRQPWSGDYWATYRGGISYRWKAANKPWSYLSSAEKQLLYAYDLEISSAADLEGIDLTILSPAEKYDIYNNDFNFTLTKYERRRTRVMKTVEGSQEYDPDFKIPFWEGLCHAWAPATLQYEAPKGITIKNEAGVEVPFGSSDIKALLTYNLHINQANARTKFLGQRCNLNVEDLTKKLSESEITQEQYRELYRERLKTSECHDTNAGAFHLTLANQIGLIDEGFVVDITRDAEVWNQGVYKYESSIVREDEGARENSAPGTVKTVLVETSMYYVNEVNFSWSGQLGPFDNPEGVKEYYYYLELNENDEIIGGEWAGPEDFYDEITYWPGEKDDRPDFMWKMERKDFVGFFAPLESIYQESIK